MVFFQVIGQNTSISIFTQFHCSQIFATQRIKNWPCFSDWESWYLFIVQMHQTKITLELLVFYFDWILVEITYIFNCICIWHSLNHSIYRFHLDNLEFRFIFKYRFFRENVGIKDASMLFDYKFFRISNHFIRRI